MTVIVDLGRAIDFIVRGLQADATMEDSSELNVRLYYDGGARGNPGCSGAGSLLGERSRPDQDWIVVWWEATFLGTAHTNNYAEHMALAQGLAEAARRYSQPNVAVTIVGDGMLAMANSKARCAPSTTNSPFRYNDHDQRF